MQVYAMMHGQKNIKPSYCVANHVVHPLLQEDQLRKLETLFHSQARGYEHLFLLSHFYLVCQNDAKK